MLVSKKLKMKLPPSLTDSYVSFHIFDISVHEAHKISWHKILVMLKMANWTLLFTALDINILTYHATGFFIT